MRSARFLLWPLLALTLGVLPAAVLSACPFCSAPSLTLSEQMSQSDAAVLVQWVAAEKPADSSTDGDQADADAIGAIEALGGVDGLVPVKSSSASVGSTTYEVVRVSRGGDSVKKGDRITLVRYRPGKKGDLSLLLGTKGTTLDWSAPVEITETGFNYLAQAPPPETPTAKRLEYFLKFLEFPDPLVAADAYQEFSNAPYKDIAPLAEKLPADRIAKWITSDETTPTRLGLYGLLLGLAGDADDAELMKREILEDSDQFRLGIEGVMSGYLLLAGEQGLALLEKEKLEPHYVETVRPDGTVKRENKVPFSETYAAMRAIRFMWDYGDERIEPERLKQSMRLLLDRTDLADLVIADLARWKDWSVQDRMMKIFQAKEYDVPHIKRAVVRYFLVCEASAPKDDATPPEHVVEARKHLAKLRKLDPETVQEAERFFFIE